MTAIELAALPGGKVPVWQTVKGAYRDTFSNLRGLGIAVAVPLALSLTVVIALPEEMGGLAGILRLLFGTLGAALFEVAWFRLLLLGPAAMPLLVPQINRRLLRFVGYSLLLTLLMIPAMFVESALKETSKSAPAFVIELAVILYVVGTYLTLRFSLAFSWIAIDAPQRLGASWRLTRRNGFRLLIAVGIAALPLLLPLFAAGVVIAIIAPELAEAVESGAIEGAPFWFFLVSETALLYLYDALACAILVRAFCALTGWTAHRSELLERFE